MAIYYFYTWERRVVFIEIEEFLLVPSLLFFFLVCEPT